MGASELVGAGLGEWEGLAEGSGVIDGAGVGTCVGAALGLYQFAPWASLIRFIHTSASPSGMK